MRYFFFIACFCFFSNINAQKNWKYYKAYYSEQLEVNSQVIDANTQSTIEKTEDGQTIYKIYYPETKVMTHFMTLNNRRERVLNGNYREWYDNGNLWKKGQYQNGKKIGEWKYYTHDGDLLEYGTYENDVKEGNWYDVDSLGSTSYITSYKQGKLDGIAYKIDHGDTIAVFTYQLDSLLHVNYLTEEEKSNEITGEEVFPYVIGCKNLDIALQKKCSDTKMLQSIFTNIRYPKHARKKGIEGQAIIQFVIEKDGSITNVLALRGISQEIEEECFRIIQTCLPKFDGGMQNGEKVRVQFKLPIKFRLE